MTRKRVRPPWMRHRDRRRLLGALGAVAATLVVVALAALARHQDLGMQYGHATNVEAGMARATSTPSFRSSGMPNSTLTPGAALTVDTAVVCRPGYATMSVPRVHSGDSSKKRLMTDIECCGVIVVPSIRMVCGRLHIKLTTFIVELGALPRTFGISGLSPLPRQSRRMKSRMNFTISCAAGGCHLRKRRAR